MALIHLTENNLGTPPVTFPRGGRDCLEFRIFRDEIESGEIHRTLAKWAPARAKSYTITLEDRDWTPYGMTRGYKVGEIRFYTRADEGEVAL